MEVVTAAERLPQESPPHDEVSGRRQQAGLRVLEGTSKRRGPLRVLPFLGPAFIAAIAYIDPGNFATNIAAGSKFGYALLWVIMASNLIAMVVQYLSAKLGIATGKNLPETIRDAWPRWASLALWVVAEVAAMATDLAEFLGAAIGFNLLFHVPLLIAGVMTGLATFVILGLQRRGFRPIEAVIASMVGLIAVCYLVETVLVKPNWGAIGYHTVTPYISSSSVLVSVGILGATVMPHVVYLHSALTQKRVTARNDVQKRTLLHYNAIDVVIAMVLAGLVNMAMLYMAAATFHKHGFNSISDIGVAYHTLTPLLGRFSSTIFGISLLASGLASSAVGTMAGQVIMGGFVGSTVPIWLRRAVTMTPALIAIAIAVPTTQTLILSQVVLSLVLPFAVVPLVWFTAQRGVMGVLVNRTITTVIATACAVLIVVLNALLLWQFAGGSL